MAKVECQACQKISDQALCMDCFSVATNNLKKAEDIIKSQEAKIKKMSEFIAAFDQLSKLKEKI